MLEKPEDNRDLDSQEIISILDNANGSKLARLAPTDLIPSTLKNIPGVYGNLSTFIRNYSTDIRFIITDEVIAESMEELQAEFFSIRNQEAGEDIEELFFTIKFLNPDDVIHYIKPERTDTSAEDKIEYKKEYYA